MNASTKLLLERARKRDRIADFSANYGAALYVCCAGGFFLAVLIAIGIYAHATRQPAWLNAVLQQCIAENRTPHVEKARDGTVLAVRCDREPRENAR